MAATFSRNRLLCWWFASLGLMLSHLGSERVLGQSSYGGITVQFASSSYTVDESAGTVFLTVTLSNSAAGVVTVNYATSNGTAIACTDYTTASGTLTFAPGVTSQTIGVGIIDNDNYSNQSLNFTAALSNPSSNATLAAPSTTTVNVLDDDPIPPNPKPPFHVVIRRLVNEAGPINVISAANKNQDVLPGQKMHLYASIIGPPLGFPKGTTLTYTWTLPGMVFRDYRANQKKSILTRMDSADLSGGASRREIQFYWADTGDGRLVTCKVTASNGMQAEGKATLNVKVPTVKGFEATIGKIQKSADGYRVGLYAAGGFHPGISFGNVKVTVPAGFEEGKWNYVQLVKPGNFRTLEDGTRQQSKNYGNWVLDTTYPYEPSPYGSYPVGSPIAGSYATGNTPQSVKDTPSDSILPAAKNKGRKNHQWDMYVMFLPPGVDSRYVPLQKIAWRVSYTITYSAAGWRLAKGAVAKADPPVVVSVHPQWTANSKPFKWVKAE